MHCTEKFETNTLFPEMNLRGLFPNLYIHLSGSNLYILTIGLIWNVLHSQS
jgi:hypothetical protein